MSYISDFEQVLASVARERLCQGVICGHIHHPDDRMIGSIRYLNSGDWVETLSALTEDYQATGTSSATTPPDKPARTPVRN